MLKASALSCAYDGDPLFQDFDLVLGPGDRIGVVGPNGAGKTTLLRTLAGELRPADGTVTRGPGTRISHVAQQVPDPDGTVGDFLTGGLGELASVTTRLRELEKALADNRDVLDEYGAVQERWTVLEGWIAETKLGEVRQRLDIGHIDDGRPLRDVSGGEQARLMLARALLAEPDVLLLDEPTNHLDVDSIEWLEEYLDGLDASLIFVSHDRWFLESVATSVLELERGKGRMTKGSYSHWRLERAERMASQADQFERQQQELAHLQRFVDRFRYGTKSRQAQSKLKVMARIERVERPREQRSLRFDFPPPARSGRVVMEAEGLSVSVAGRELVHDATFHIERGQRVALIGRNGAGKTTLLETLLGRRPADHGRAKLGHGVSLAYYSQQSLELPEQARLVDAVGHGTKLTGPQARMLLGRFLFSGDQVEKPVSVLSGGERRRLALARIVVSGANLLVLDEPTNHLDVESREALEDALDSFPGTILFVSHDRALIEALATRTIAIEDGRLRLRDGAFGEYARDHEPVVAKDPPGRAPPKPKPPASARAAAAKPARSGRSLREARELESQIERLEEELGAVSARLSQPDAYRDHTAVAEDGHRHQQLQVELAHLYREWERRVG